MIFWNISTDCCLPFPFSLSKRLGGGVSSPLRPKVFSLISQLLFYSMSAHTLLNSRIAEHETYHMCKVVSNTLPMWWAHLCAHLTLLHYATGTFVSSDVVQSYKVNIEAKWAFGVNPCLLSSNKCRPHLSTPPPVGEAGRGGVSSWLFRRWSNAKLFLEHRE